MRPPIEFMGRPPPANPLIAMRLPPPSLQVSRSSAQLLPPPQQLTRPESAAAILQAPRHRRAPETQPAPLISSRPTTSTMQRNARKAGGNRVEWDLANGEGKWILGLRHYSYSAVRPRELPPTPSRLGVDSGLLRTTTASRMFSNATLAAAKEIPYSNALERWQNDLRCPRPGTKHAYSNYCEWLGTKHLPMPATMQLEDVLARAPLPVPQPRAASGEFLAAMAG